MSGSQIQAVYFSPIMYFIYLFIIFVLMILYYQWSWAKKCNNNVKVLVVKPDGTTDTEYAPKQGGYVALKAADSNTTRLWPINKFSTIEESYPGDGFIPKFLQKKIKTVIVTEEDWEPLLNRGSYTENVASPDVVHLLRQLACEHADAAGDLTDLADSLSTAPTRDQVASPAVLGNIMKEKVSELAVTISKDTFDKLEAITSKLANVPNALITYLGMGLIIILLVIVVVKVVPGNKSEQNITNISNGIQSIESALGIQQPTPTAVPK